MILFALRCSSGHEFEAWFRDNAAYDRQIGRGLVACPDCGLHTIEKAPMAPRLGRSQGTARAPETPPAPAEAAPPLQPDAPAQGGPVPPEAPPTPQQVRRALQVLRRHVEQTCDYVGPGFAAEARRIHNGDAKARGIYGEASPAEAKALIEDGVDIASIPWVPSSDA